MNLYKNLCKLTEEMQISSGEVISSRIMGNDNIDVSLFGLAKGELISFERADYDRIYLPLEGILKMKLNKNEDGNFDEYQIKPYDFTVVEKNLLREITGDTNYKLLMITIKRRETMLKNIDKQELLKLDEVIEYREDKIASKTLANDEKLSMTLLSFDGKQELSTHSAPGDALVIGLDGEARINIDGEDFQVKKGDSIIMPANIPHGVYVEGRYKMLLIVSK